MSAGMAEIGSGGASDLQRRFGGLQRLYGLQALELLARAHVVVAGIGGVGSWCAEALARSGVGALTLVDLDHIAESNINRQVHALEDTVGQSKVGAMAARIAQINAQCRVRCVDDFADAANLGDILCGAPGVLIDCTDQISAKIAMVLQARARGWRLVVCGGAGGKTNPFSLRQGDLATASHDALLARLRQQLRKIHGYPSAGGAAKRKKPPRMGVDCLWFEEQAVLPDAWRQAGQGGGQAPQGLSCAGYGSAVTITATMGLAAANSALQFALRAGDAK